MGSWLATITTNGFWNLKREIPSFIFGFFGDFHSFQRLSARRKASARWAADAR